MLAAGLVTNVTDGFVGEGPESLDKVPPQSAPFAEIEALRNKLADTLSGIRNKRSALTVQDLKRLLFRCAATLISLQKVRATGLSSF